VNDCFSWMALAAYIKGYNRPG